MKNPKRFFDGIPPQVWLLGFISFFADVASEMLYPVIPQYLTLTLGASVAAMGLIESCAELTAALLKGASGRYTDLTGRGKHLVILGYTISAIAKPLTGFASSWGHVLGARSLDRVGKGLRSSPRDALLSKMVSKENLGKAFGIHRGMDTLGAVVGPLLCIGLLSIFHGNLRNIFVFSLFPGLIGAALCFFIKDLSTKRTFAWRHIGQLFYIPKPEGHLPKSFWLFIITWGAFSIVNSSDLFLLLKMQKGGSLTSTIYLYAAYNLSFALLSPIIGAISDKIPRYLVLCFGLMLFALVYAGFSFPQAMSGYVILFLVYGIFNAATDGVSKAFASELLPENLRGSGLGILNMVSGFGLFISSILAGIIWEQISPSAPFILGAAGAFIAAIGIFAIGRFQKSFA
jgi:MFS family permease